ncbi:undecaprenyl diphosphate synthase [Fibrobacter sp. UWH9]|uniref:isoprenyl transferase n=1 Tax=unclassified Fibrobacter TaxID=2634177 RepID=UPI0009178F41|nr:MULTISPECIES: isoprenyl transferase [unclassified Fibrobacter]MCL4101181.1 Isoprenyl transferase [Fibrobacter succinogenes]MCQ2100706.1 isoprenyl transferase [Fibrobacter sp.]MDO4948091.1 isoprenyl transferase [Fibrobacter sp.]OWV04618.1 isoprenyl transferase [Fibrobacter sp. UWH3]OWV14908.1 isoprenyl transferase [Fibrobacter sp. UWH1]
MANQLRHVAIIMDGNGRWAKSRGMERFFGHRKGTESTIDAVEMGVNLKLEHMTLYVFSSENWGRPSKEVDYLMNLLIEMVVKEIPDLMEKNVKLTVIGNMDRIPEKPRASLQSAIDITANNTGMQLNLAISYGGRQEIVGAVKSIAAQVAAGSLSVDDIDETLFAKNLYLKGAPDPDLIIRTGGEFRLSNYLLWQAAYSEFYVTDTLWPDFTKDEFMQAVEFFNTRERRFGKVLHE